MPINNNPHPQYVAILDKNGGPVGGGCLVGKRLVITCAHVVELALGRNVGTIINLPSDNIKVRFPLAEPAFFADCRVVEWHPVDNGYFPHENEDLALLEIDSDKADLIVPKQPLGQALTKLDINCYKPITGHAFGSIESSVAGGRIQIRRSPNHGVAFEPGFSGAPIFTADVNELFCGIIMSGRISDNTQTVFGKSTAIIRKVIDEYTAKRHVARPLNSTEAEAFVAEKKRAQVATSNPYLLGKQFHGRESELAQLTDWICEKDDKFIEVRIFCISNLGGTGKSALVHHWLNLNSSKEALNQKGLPTPFWASFYSKNFSFPEMLDKLKDYVGISVDHSFVVQGTDAYQRLIVREVLKVLKQKPMLLILDGLEREMGAFSASVNRGLDSEEQDVRAESGKVPASEKCLREGVFQELLVGLAETKAKVILTTRHTPEELRDRPQSTSRVYIHDLKPLDEIAACSIWREAVGSGKDNIDDFVYSFFILVDYHPQAIVAVAAAFASSPGTSSFREWFDRFELEQQVRCNDRDALKTTLRHRWIDLATLELKLTQPKVWLLLVEINHHASAVQVATLREILIRSKVDVEKGRALFENDNLFDDALKQLEKLRLVGISECRQTVDIHPVIRTNVRQWAFSVLRNPAAADEETLRAVRGDGDGELAQRFWASSIEQQFKTLQAADSEERDQLVGGQSMLRQKLAEMYQLGGDKARPWMKRLPKFSLRRNQADCVYLTANALMVNGDWDDSRYLYKVAKELYALCGDTASVGDCMWSMNWQLIYGGDLFESERTVLNRLLTRDPKNLRSDINLFWLALLLGVRKHKLTPHLLSIIDKGLDRWTLQAASETQYYLENYNDSRELVLRAMQRSEERIERRQELWERISLGLSEMRMQKYDQAFENLGRARATGIGLGYEIITIFALAGFIETRFEASLDPANSHFSAESLHQGVSAHKQYRALDSKDRYQIPATDAHLAAAKIYEALGERDKAMEWGCIALKVSRRNGEPFIYKSGERRALEFLRSINANCVNNQVNAALNAIDLSKHERLIAKTIKLIEGGDHAIA